MIHKVTTSTEEQELLDEAGINLSENLESKKEEMVNLAKQARNHRVIEAYEKAEPGVKSEFRNLISSVETLEASKLLEEVIVP